MDLKKKFSEIREDLKDETAQVSFADLSPIAIGFVVIAIVIAVGAIVLQELQGGLAEQTANSSAFNITQQGTQALVNLSGQLPLLATVIIFAVIIAVVVGFFAFSAISGRGGSGAGPGSL